MKNTFNLKTVDNMSFSKYIGIKVLALYLAVLCLGCFSIFVFVKGLKATKEYTYTYTENNNVDYFVYLKENDYFEEEYLGKGTNYIASLIDKINIDFYYKLSSEEILNGNYDYEVTATMEAKEKGKEVIIWSKDEELFPKKSEEFLNKNSLDVGPTVSIDYAKYNAMMSEFKSSYGVAIDANLVINFKVNTSIQNKDQKELSNDTSLSTVTIPLLVQTVEIEDNYSSLSNKENTVTYKTRTIWHYVLVATGVILFVYYLYLSLRVLKLIFAVHKNKNKYQIKLKKILSDYDQIIVKVNNFPELKTKSILDLDNFNDLVDAQTELREPILFREIISNQESIFMISKDDKVFRYKMKYTDFI